ncbi:MAG: hypothetical protein J6S67_19340 [Methanobrevibacter sp.]|nr:hypothetical protein [Methanobrevibacter sp.]
MTDPVISEWLDNLFDTEIGETRGTIANEKIWLRGSDTPEQEYCHMKNIETLNQYIEVLENLKATAYVGGL